MGIMAGGGGGSSGYPGVIPDGVAPGGMIVKGGITVGDPNEDVSDNQFSGTARLWVIDTPSRYTNGFQGLSASEYLPVPADTADADMVNFTRAGDISLSDYASPMVHLNDSTASGQAVLYIVKGGVERFRIIGSTKPSVTGALSLVTDTNAKNVLTSIIGVLNTTRLATQNTT